MYSLFVVLGLILVCNAKYVYKYSQEPAEDEAETVLDILRKPVVPELLKYDDLLKQWGINKPRLGSFQWKDCNGAGASVQSVTLTPDPLSFPGSFTLGFKAMINTTVVAPLKGDLLIEKKIGSTYIKIPCIGNFGSCTYDDVCQLLQTVTCPDPFTKAGIDCQCPFKTGNYNVPQASFDVDSSAFPSGDYHIKGAASNNGKVMACLDIYLSVSS